MSCQAKSERAKRLERWAETALAMIMRHGYNEASEEVITKRAWAFAVHMEDQRTRVLGYLHGLDPQDPNEPAEKPAWER